jgi:hypothetical protein
LKSSISRRGSANRANRARRCSAMNSTPPGPVVIDVPSFQPSAIDRSAL